jgi:hypothetical protein
MIAGAGAGFGMIYLSDTVDGSGWPDTLALGVGSVPLIIAAMIVLQMATRRGADVLKGCGGLQVLVMGLAGVMMLLPIVGSRFASPGLVMAALAIMLVVQTLANLLLWAPRRRDVAPGDDRDRDPGLLGAAVGPVPLCRRRAAGPRSRRHRLGDDGHPHGRLFRRLGHRRRPARHPLTAAILTPDPDSKDKP